MDSTIFTYDPPSYVKDWAFEDPNVLPTKTIFDFGNGDVSAVYLEGMPAAADLTAIGIKVSNSEWNKQPVRVKLGSELYGLSSNILSYANQLTSIYVPENITRLGAYVFRGCSNLQNLDIAGAVSASGAYCFAYCSSLITIDLPDSLTSYGLYAFTNCAGLISIEIPLGAGTIQTGMLRNCVSMTYVKMPSTIKNVNANGLGGCSNLTDIDFREAAQVPTLGANTALTGTPANMQIVVPDGLYDSWILSGNWTNYKNNIVKASQSRLGPLT